MMKTQNKKRGFTIIELVIVVTVIAILSAVLIPTFAGVIKRSKQSADETAVRNLNTVIATADKDIDTVEDLVAFLESENIAMDSYVPMSKGYSFVWSDAENMVMLYSEKDKEIVFPAAYAGKSVAFVTIVTEDEETPITAENHGSFTSGGVVAVKNDVTVESYISVANELTVDLSATVSMPNYVGAAGVFTTNHGGYLTLNGNGTVNGLTAGNAHIAVWAYKKSEIVINGGNYTNVGAKNADGTVADQYDFIYASKGGKITINGGTFKAATPEWTLNALDDTVEKDTFVVKGGEFFEFDPSNVTTEPAASGITSWVAEGYKAVPETREDGTWYVVKPVQA